MHTSFRSVDEPCGNVCRWCRSTTMICVQCCKWRFAITIESRHKLIEIANLKCENASETLCGTLQQKQREQHVVSYFVFPPTKWSPSFNPIFSNYPGTPTFQFRRGATFLFVCDGCLARAPPFARRSRLIDVRLLVYIIVCDSSRQEKKGD